MRLCILSKAHRQVCEDLEGAAQKVDEVHEVAAGPAVRLGHAPLVVGQLDELVDLLVELGVDLAFCCVPGILKTKEPCHECSFSLK